MPNPNPNSPPNQSLSTAKLLKNLPHPTPTTTQPKKSNVDEPDIKFSNNSVDTFQYGYIRISMGGTDPTFMAFILRRPGKRVHGAVPGSPKYLNLHGWQMLFLGTIPK
jgi:hypothetical protein